MKTFEMRSPCFAQRGSESHPSGGRAPGRRPLPLEGVPLVEGEAALAEPQQLPDVLVQSSSIVTSTVIDRYSQYISKKAH